MNNRTSVIFLDSSMVEHSAVNRVVAGSSPARGANKIKQYGRKAMLFFAYGLERAIKNYFIVEKHIKIE